MINVMLVEDEPPVMRVFGKLLESHGSSFTVAATAINGKRALEILKKQNIDVVFTDIRMPIMDGLELAGELQKAYPDIYTVLVSGYQDFEYARRAIQYHVFDYLLKPVSKDDLGVLLDKLEVAVNASLREKKRKNVMNAISQNSNEKNYLKESDCAVLLICAGAFPLSYDDSMFPSHVFWDGIDVMELIKDFPEFEDNSMFFNGKTAFEKVVVIEMDNNVEPKKIIDSIYNRLIEKGKMPITIASFDKTISINSISDGLRVLRSRLYTGIRFGHSAVLTQDFQPKEHISVVVTQALSESVIRAVSTGDKHILEKILCDVFEKLYSAQSTQLELVGFLRGVVSMALSQSDPFESTLMSVNHEIDEAISNATDIKGLTDDIASILFGVKERKSGINVDKTPALIHEIEVYLKENYNSPITNTVLSQKFRFVPSYLSRLFKTYMGISPSEYLTNCRIEKAKKLIKEQPELMVKEIAAKVGINDQYYFSKLFKKETGQWPTEFGR